MTLSVRAEVLIQEFQKDAETRHGIANVLEHLINTEESIAWHQLKLIPCIQSAILKTIIEELRTPTLLDRALAGDSDCAKQFLQEIGIIDSDGQLTPAYKSDK